jgi:hypothetical protein
LLTWQKMSAGTHPSAIDRDVVRERIGEIKRRQTSSGDHSGIRETTQSEPAQLPEARRHGPAGECDDENAKQELSNSGHP